MLWADAIEAAEPDARMKMGFGPFFVAPWGDLLTPYESIIRGEKRNAGEPKAWPIARAPGWIRHQIDADWSILAWCALGAEWTFEPIDLNVKRIVIIPSAITSSYRDWIVESLTEPLRLTASGAAFAFCEMLFILPEQSFEWNSFVCHPKGYEPLSVFVGYRGHTKPFPEVITPGVFRGYNQRFRASYSERARIAANVVKQVIYESENIALTNIQARGLLQHYGIIGPTDILDLSYDINIAKWFALNVWDSASNRYRPKVFEATDEDASFDECSVVYTVVVRLIRTALDDASARALLDLSNLTVLKWNAPGAPADAPLDSAPARNIAPLWSERPSRQSGFGVSHIGPQEDDDFGSIVAIVEHRFHPTFSPHGWDAIGGAMLVINRHSYQAGDDTSMLSEFVLPASNAEIVAIQNHCDRIISARGL